MRKILSTIAIAAVAVMAFTSAASAEKSMTTVLLSNAFLTNGASMFNGELAAFHNCGKRRVVLIYLQRPGPDQRIGETRAKYDAGITYSWDFAKVGYAVKAGERYYVKIRPTKKCMGARSALVQATVY
jgi:hypothetical protein